MTLRTILALLFALPLAACGGDNGEEAATAAARGFYDKVLAARSGGVPDEVLRAGLRSVISPDLDSLIAQAAEAERRHTARVNNGEPPYLQGDIFSSLFEGPTAYEIGSCEELEENGDPSMRCDVLLVHEAEEPVQWTDHVSLVADGVPEERRWLVDDILYGGDWDFGPKGSLKAVLRGAIAQEE